MKTPDKTPKTAPSAEIQTDRRAFLGAAAILGAGALATAPQAEAREAKATTGSAPTDAQLRAHIDTVVVIYLENRSFNNLFANFPGELEPLSSLPPERSRQRDRNGQWLPHLPPVWRGLVPHEQVVEHRPYQIGEADLAPIPNGAFALVTPQGDPLPNGLVTRDLVHKFYENQYQINGGRNDGFAAYGDSGALVMGHYSDSHAQLRLWDIAREFTLCDRFFMGAFGGSYLNHQYLVAAQPPVYPDAEHSPAAALIAGLEDGPTGIKLKLSPETPASALDGPARFVESSITPDGFSVNTMLPPYAPTYDTDPANPALGNPANPMTLPAQHHKNIGDMLSAKGVEWAWYGGAFGEAMKGNFEDKTFPTRPNFQPHHQPLNYFARFAPGTADRAKYLRDGGLGDTARTNHFLADAEAGTLPPVSYYKPQGNLTMHAGYSDVDSADRHMAAVIAALRASPQWDKMLVVITFDENGGWWDHVAPPKADRWGPGTRIPALVISPHAKRGHVDHTVYDTGSIARFITRRFGLEKLPGLALREKSMQAASGFMPGDLTAALAFPQS